jgi:hypothetical protein
MKDLQERAENYAAEKMNELIAKAITQAFVDGYKTGFEERNGKIDSMAYIDENITVHDLGLPSGTLWSLDYLKDENEQTDYLPYVKAARLGLPSKEQVEELIEHCKWQGDFSSTRGTFYGANCIGATGESIRFGSRGYKENESVVDAPYYGGGNAYFWIQDDEVGVEKNAVRIYDVRDGEPEIEIVKIFSGYKLPVLIVRK